MRDPANTVHVSFDELAAHPAAVIDRVSQAQEVVVIEQESREVAVLLPPDHTRLMTGRMTKVASAHSADRDQKRLPACPDIDSVVGAAGSLNEPLAWRAMREIAAEDHAAEVIDAHR